MALNLRHPRIFVTAIICLALCSARVTAQGSGSSRTDPQRATRPQTPEEFHNSFWRYIVKKDAAYNTWKVLEHESVSDGVENPHSTKSRTYAEKTAGDDPANLPVGSILVREDYDAEGKRQSISVMYRVKDYDKDHGNWYWLRYLENGSVSKGAGDKLVAGKVTSCVECHAKAKGNDFVFSNDALKNQTTSRDASAPPTSDTSGASKAKE